MLPSEGACPLIHACHFHNKQQPQNTAKSELKRAGRATTGPSGDYGSQPPRRLHTDGVTPVLVRNKRFQPPSARSTHTLTCVLLASRVAPVLAHARFLRMGRGGGFAVPPRSDFRVFNANVRHNPQSLNPGDKVTPSLATVVILDLITAQ